MIVPSSFGKKDYWLDVFPELRTKIGLHGHTIGIEIEYEPAFNTIFPTDDELKG